MLCPLGGTSDPKHCCLSVLKKKKKNDQSRKSRRVALQFEQARLRKTLCGKVNDLEGCLPRFTFKIMGISEVDKGQPTALILYLV